LCRAILEARALLKEEDRKPRDGSKSAKLLIEQYDLATDRYKEILAEILYDNNGKMTLSTDSDDYIQLSKPNAKDGSILKKIGSDKPTLHKLVFAYDRGDAKAVASLSKDRGGATIDHKDGHRNNNPDQLWKLAHEVNNFKKSEENKRKAGKRFGLPLHKTMFTVSDPDTRKNGTAKKFIAPFTKEKMMSCPSGKRLYNKYGYREGNDYRCSHKDVSRLDQKGTEVYFNRIVVDLCSFFIHLIKNDRTFCESMGKGWLGQSGTNTAAYFKQRKAKAEAFLTSATSAGKKRKRDFFK